MKTPKSAGYEQKLFNALVRPASVLENDNMGGSDTSRKPGLGFQTYTMNHIVPKTAREEKGSDDKKLPNKREKTKFIDPELEREISYAKHHYTDYEDDDQMAFNKYIDRTLLNIKKSNKAQSQEIKDIRDAIDSLRRKIKSRKDSVVHTPDFDIHQDNPSPDAHLKDKITRQEHQGDLVGEAPSLPKPKMQLKTARHQAKSKIKAAYFGKVSENTKLIPVSESIENIMDSLINQIICNETVSNNK